MRIREDNKITSLGWLVLAILIAGVAGIILGAIYHELKYVGYGGIGLLICNLFIWYDKKQIRKEIENNKQV